MNRVRKLKCQHLVFDLYGVTSDEVQLLHSTTPPRDPLAFVEAADAGGTVQDRTT